MLPSEEDLTVPKFLREELLGDNVLKIELDRPPANALTVAFLDEIENRLAALRSGNTVRAIIITGAGKALSAGLDLKEAQHFSAGQQSAMADALNRAYGALYSFPKPVIAAVNGPAIAGGLFFVLTADYRIAAPQALFGLTEVRVGVQFPVAPLEIARAELAPAQARRFLLSGRNAGTDTALDAGVIDEVVEPDALMKRSFAVARDYAALPPKAFAGIKAQLRAPALSAIRAAIEQRNDPTLEGWFTDETAEAARILLATAGRKPQS